ncbi:MAG: hypothetical protein ACKPER_16620 [Dolichospermum sp.]
MSVVSCQLLVVRCQLLVVSCQLSAVIYYYSDFQSYKVHLSPLLAPSSLPPLRREEKDKLLILEGVGGGVLVPGLMTICCN